MEPLGPEPLQKLLAGHNIASETGAELARHTTFRLGGPCPLLIQCHTPGQVTLAVRALAESGVEFLLIGGGSNLLVSDHGVDQVVIRFVNDTPEIGRRGTELEVSGGTSLDALAEYCVEAGLDGLVNASGIPGTVGGAIAGNAGAFGWQISECLEAMTLLDRQGNLHEARPEELGFSYRYSGLRRSGEIVLAARFRLEPAEREALRTERQRILGLRAEKHPDLKEYACAGSFFRNLEPGSNAARREAAGCFLEQAGAKQMRVGGAGVFPRHANIIIKLAETCRAQDVYTLSRRMAAAVKEKFGLDLVPEVRLIGRFAETSTG